MLPEVKPTPQTPIRVLLVGVSKSVINLVRRFISPEEVKHIQTSDQLLDFLDLPEAQTYHIAIAGPLIEDLDTVEIAQSLRGSMREAKILFCHDSRDMGFNHYEFVKNGFTEAFLLPFDTDEFRSSLESFAVKIRELAVYRPVRVVDIQEGSVLDFDLYILLPANRKYLHYSSAGCAIESGRLERLKNHSVGAVFVPLEQMDKFYDYSASRLKTLLGQEEALNETQRRDRLQLAVRDLMLGIFNTEEKTDFEEGKRMLENTTEIIKSFILQSPQADLYTEVLRTIGDISNSYSHLSNVSTYAALFSMATGVGQPEELAIAALFHDLGLSIVPASIQEKPEEDWTNKEREIYESHPEYSLNLVKNRKMVLSQSIQTMILQHHERADGSGYPLKLTEPKLKLESQLLAIADEFDELTCFEMGHRALRPEEALLHISNSKKFNLTLIAKLNTLFKKAA